MLDPAKFKSRKKKEEDNDGLCEVKKRRMPPGHIPFRRIKIPEQWKKDMKVVERCVSDAFTSCTYPSLEKKERLRSAVLDVFTETRTMKESSIFYNVPFTTVQTYFHKSCKLVEEAIPFDDNLEAEVESNLKRNKPTCNRIGDVLQRLSGIKCEIPSPETSTSTPVTAHLTGASKRKPKFVRRIVNSAEFEEDPKEVDPSFNLGISNSFPLEALSSQQILMLAELTSTVVPLEESENRNNDMVADEDVDVGVVPDWCWQELAAYIASVSGVCEEIRTRLRAAICDVHANKMSIQDACLIHNLGFNYLLNYYEAFQTRLRKQARFIMSLFLDGSVEEVCHGQSFDEVSEAEGIMDTEKLKKVDGAVLLDKKLIKGNEEEALPGSSERSFENGKELIGKRHKEKEKYGPPLDPADIGRLKAIEEGVIEACKPSTYSDSQKKRLHMAVSMVVRGEGPVSVAASKSHLPPSTVQLYAQRTRMALGLLLPPPAASLRRSIATQETGRSSVEKSSSGERNWSRDLKERDSMELYETQSSSKKRKAIAQRDVETNYLDVHNASQGIESLGSSSLSDVAVQMLAKVDFNAVLSAEIKCTKEELIRKIDAILRNFHYQNDFAVMRDALLGIFLEGKTVEEACQLTKLKAQEVGAYMALVKVYCESKKQEFQKDVADDDGETKTTSFFDDVPHRKTARRSTSSLRSSIDFTMQHRNEVEQTHSSETSVKSREGSSESRSHDLESTRLMDKIDVMLLHSDTIRNSEELCMKTIIAYLVQEQYRRSKESQGKLRSCLENVLLDGLQLKETLMLIKGPSEHVLQAYVARCRDAKSCITNDFSTFVSESLKLLKEVDLERIISEDFSTSGMRRSDSSTTIPSSTLRTPRKTKKNVPLLDSGISISVGNIEHLNLLLTEKVLDPFTAYLEKLSAINFPIETSLITGLVRILLQHMPSQFEFDVPDELLLEWADEYRDKHSEFYH